MKKVLSLALCITLAGLLAVNGTFAADFTQAIGEVVSSIFQTVGELVNPEPTADPAEFNVALTFRDGQDQPILNPNKPVKREAAVINNSTSHNAYFCIAFAVQAEAFDHLTMEFNNDESQYKWLSNYNVITIGEHQYKLIVGIYQHELEPSETSPAALKTITLDKDITNEQLDAFCDEFLQIKALAICADDFDHIKDGSAPFASAEAALKSALQIENKDFNPFIQ